VTILLEIVNVTQNGGKLLRKFTSAYCKNRYCYCFAGLNGEVNGFVCVATTAQQLMEVKEREASEKKRIANKKKKKRQKANKAKLLAVAILDENSPEAKYDTALFARASEKEQKSLRVAKPFCLPARAQQIGSSLCSALLDGVKLLQ
jgi:sRNA-binding protein